ncbi:MAG: CoA transferase [Halioglobus sp.]|nr:CoA transferase [Halioglobus sp.]
MNDSLFSDLLVLDCASFIAGPAAATMLSDFGARVIKIESPHGGDGYRMFQNLPGLPKSERDYHWALTNRNKESVALDLKDETGRQSLDALVAKADVFITNLPLPVRKRLRIGAADIRAINPAIIYASLTPYGETGPEAESTGYDATAWWARSGLMDYVRASADTPPAVSVPGMGDHMTACSLYGAIVTALYRRQQTGEGAEVGSSLMANGLWSNGLMVQAALDGADMSQRQDYRKLSPFTQTYRCGDGRWFMLTILPQAQERAWPRIAAALERTEWLEDARFATMESRHEHKEILRGEIADILASRDWSHWQAVFNDYGITCGRIAQTEDHCEDAQANESGALVDFADGTRRTVDSPLYVSGATKRVPTSAPTVGQDTDRILNEFNIGS